MDSEMGPWNDRGKSKVFLNPTAQTNTKNPSRGFPHLVSHPILPFIHRPSLTLSSLLQPGGQDSQLVLPDTLHTFVSTNYLLRTNDAEPAFITVQTTGWRTGPREVMQRLFDPAQADGVDPSEYSFRLSIKLETGDERYAGVVNSGMWIGSGARKGAEGEFS
jgi:hypothetical protein